MGFVVARDEVFAQTRTGRQVLLTYGENVKAMICAPVAEMQFAVVGENRKVLVFAYMKLPEMGRGQKGVRDCRNTKMVGIVDGNHFFNCRGNGLSWQDSRADSHGATSPTLYELGLGKRATCRAGMAPHVVSRRRITVFG